MQRFAPRRLGRLSYLAVLSAVVSSLTLSLVSVSTPVAAASKTSEDRIAMPRRNLSPTVTARRALGAAFVDRVSVAFDVRLGTDTIGRLSGLVDLATGSADLQFLAPDNDGVMSETPYRLRVRGERMQVILPAALQKQAGVNGYVTTMKEGTYGGVSVDNEVLLSVALLTALPLPLSVASWDLPPSKSKKAATTKPAAKGDASSSSSPVTAVPRNLNGVATRTDFKVLTRERFGDKAEVELALRPEGNLRGMTIRFTPLKAAAAEGLRPFSLVGTVTRSTKDLNPVAPTGTFLTASRFFELDPLPEDVDVPEAPETGIEADAA